MKRMLHFVLIMLLIYSTGHAGIYTDSPDSRIKIVDSAGTGKLVYGSDIGDGSSTFFEGTIQVSDAYLNRRLEELNQGDGVNKTVYLKQATVVTGTSRAYVSAQYVGEAEGADALDRYQLVDGTLGFIRFAPGQEVRELVLGSGAAIGQELWIQGAPIFKTPPRFNDITGAGVRHTIHWGLTSKLNQTIALRRFTAANTNTTQFILETDLRLGDGVAFLPSNGGNPFDGYDLQVTFSNSKLALGGTDLSWRSTLLLENAGDVEMNANVKLGSAWLFSGNGMLQGNGNILDLSGRDADSTGTVGFDVKYLRDNPAVTVTLFLRDIKLRLRNGALFTHERTVLDLSNVEIELENTVNFTSGNIRISGPTMIYSKNHTFSISHGATMTVDGTVLYYDSGQHYNKQGVFPNDVLDDDKTVMGEALNFQHDGYIQMIAKPEVTLIITPGGSGGNIGNIDSGAGNVVTDPYQFTVDKDLWLSGDVQLIFDNAGNTDNARFYYFNGDNHFVHFARESNCLLIHDNVRVHFVNTVFKDFDPTGVQLDGSGATKAQLFFGQGCVLELGEDTELGESGDSLYTLSFQLEDNVLLAGEGTPGNENIAKINGQGHSLSLPYAGGQSTPGQIIVSGASEGLRLELENITIDKLGGWPRRFEAEHPTAQIYAQSFSHTVLYRNARLNLSNNYSYTQAGMMIDGIVNIDTRQNTKITHPDDTSRTDNIFIFQPARKSTLTFSHNAQLIVGRNVTFSLDPMVTRTTMAGMLVNGGTPFSGGSTGNVEYDEPWKAIVFPGSGASSDDGSAVMHFNGSTLHVTGTGLFLKYGAVTIENHVTWVAKDDTHGGNAQQKISLQADTVTPFNDVTVNILAGATLDIQGPVYYEDLV